MKLINGSLYLVRWKGRKDAVPEIARYSTDVDAPERDPDEIPRREWYFFGSEIQGAFDRYEVISRLDVVPISPDNPNVQTWEDR